MRCESSAQRGLPEVLQQLQQRKLERERERATVWERARVGGGQRRGEDRVARRGCAKLKCADESGWLTRRGAVAEQLETRRRKETGWLECVAAAAVACVCCVGGDGGTGCGETGWR